MNKPERIEFVSEPGTRKGLENAAKCRSIELGGKISVGELLREAAKKIIKKYEKTKK